MSSPKISDKEKKSLHKKAKKEMERMEAFISNYDTIQLIDAFRNKYNICETVYKVFLTKYLNSKEKNNSEYLKVTMTQVPYVLDFAGYSFEKTLLNELFGASSKKGKTVKKLRDAVTHGIDEKAVEEIKKRQDELFRYMDSFLSVIRSFDNNESVHSA